MHLTKLLGVVYEIVPEELYPLTFFITSEIIKLSCSIINKK